VKLLERVEKNELRDDQVDCPTCGWFDKVLDFVEAGGSLASFVGRKAVGQKVDQKEHDRRKAICESCTAVDSKGDRMFRNVALEKDSCGVPRFKRWFRISETEGCGCWLNLKWWGRGQKCPLKEPKW
jgi:hypothetical protein